VISSQESLGADFADSRDVVDEYIEELNASKQEDWRKWVAIAMLFEFGANDVIKGVWIYSRRKTTADFYESIYGESRLPFVEYLAEWGEELPVSVEWTVSDPADPRRATSESVQGVHEHLLVSDESMHSMGSLASMGSMGSMLAMQSKHSFAESSPAPYITREAISPRHSDKMDGISATKNRDSVMIKGPRQNSVYSALSTSDTHSIAASPSLPKQHQQTSKLSKMLDGNFGL